MKKPFYLMLIPLLCVACTDEIADDENLTTMTSVENDHSVSYNDILTLCQCQDTITRASAEAPFSIECVTSESEDTLLFIAKKLDGGWTLYASDTRVPAIVAHDEYGSYDSLMQIDGARLWIQTIAEDMSAIKSLPDNKLNFTKQEIDNNKSFWKSVKSPDEYVRENILTSTRAVDTTLLPLLLGHYQLISSTTYPEVYDSSDHLTTTTWDQEAPYNKYCPLLSNSSLVHAYAGCVAIAGAQMLLFLHDTLQVPETAPSEAYCEGDINSYTSDQTNFTSEIWTKMKSDGQYAAPLIAHVGKLVGMKYTAGESTAHTKDLVNKVFKPYGISCTYAKYDTQLLKNSLLDRMPVILRANSEDSGHSFIVDRYQRSRMVTKNEYEWVYETTPNKPVPYITKVSYEYASPYISMIGMNWGWGNYDREDWYTLTGDWYGGEKNYNTNRYMIYDFAIIPN